ncbi:MAG: hypothetical protein J6P62_05725 [Bacteroidales bacterium]|nr:hypothetical protein [Bacteroidales bacterium]
MEAEFRSAKSDSVFKASGDRGRAYLSVTGKAATVAKVKKEVERVRREGADFETAKFLASQMAKNY